MIFRTSRRLVLILLVLATIGCDRVTKHAAVTMLSGEAGHSYWGDTVRLEYVENSGAFLSLGADWPQAVKTTFFTVVTGCMLLIAGGVLIRRRAVGWSAFGSTLFLAGAASNWIDRVNYGSVVDFLNIGVGHLRTGVFNVADVAIMLGAGIVVLSEFHKDRRIRGEQPDA
jgi:signal peptidase II